MTFCIRCSPFNCNGSQGLISVAVSPSSSVRPTDDDTCQTEGANIGSSSSSEYIPGPGIINVQIVAWAFAQGDDKWLNSRCKGSAQAGQTNIQRYDFTTDKWHLIPSKVHRAQINGVIGNCSLGQVFFTGSTADSQIINNSSITTELGVQIGAEFSYTGYPLAINVPDLKPYRISLGTGDLDSGYINSVNVSVDYPTPAVITYNFDFPIEN